MTCTICKHPDVNEIDAAILQEVSARTLALKYGIKHHDRLVRHRKNCLSDKIGYLNEERGALHARVAVPEVKRALAAIEGSRVKIEPGVLETSEDILAAARRMFHELEEVTQQSRRLGDTRMTLLAIREGTGLLQFFARAFRMFDESGTKVDNSVKIVNYLGGLPEEQLRAISEGRAIGEGMAS